jgi:hypothetical protein
MRLRLRNAVTPEETSPPDTVCAMNSDPTDGMY